MRAKIEKKQHMSNWYWIIKLKKIKTLQKGQVWKLESKRTWTKSKKKQIKG
jgi:hypothetical protein